LAKFWWWEGLAIKAVVEEDPQKTNRFILRQTIDSPEYDLLQSPKSPEYDLLQTPKSPEFDSPQFSIKPYKMGYMEISNVRESQSKPIDIRLVCLWPVVTSFWKELETNLRKEYLVIDTSSEIDYLRAKLPKSKASLSKWIFIANIINRSSYPAGLKSISKVIKDRYPGYPHSREALGIIFRAKNVGLLEPPDSKKSG